MTSAEFAAAYRVLRRITHEGVRSYTAQHVATQRPVMVHFLDGVPEPERASVMARLDRLEPADRARVYERTEVEGGPVVVTQILAGFASLPAWLASRTDDQDAEGFRGPAVIADRGVERPALRDVADTPAPAAPSSPASHATPASPLLSAPLLSPPPAASKAPGEFTRMFSAPPAAPAQQPETAPRFPESPAPVPAAGPGPDRAAMPREPGRGAGREAPAGASSGEQRGGVGGGFTDIFGAAPVASSTGAHPSPAASFAPPVRRPEPAAPPAVPPLSAPAEPNRAPSLEAPPIVEAGEFTRMFRPRVTPSQPPLSATPFTPPRASSPPAALPPTGRPPIGGSATGALEARPLVPPVSRTPPSPAPSPIASPTEFPPPLSPEFLNQAGVPAGQGVAGSPPFSAAPPPGGPAPRPPASAPPASAGPSEFTRIIAGPVSPALQRAASAGAPAAPPPAPAAAPASGSAAAPATGAEPKAAGGGTSPAPNWSSYIPLLLVLNFIAIVAMGLIIYFAVK